MKTENPNPDDEADLEETIARVNDAEKELREKALPIWDVEATAREHRIRLERSAEELGLTRIDLTALRGRAGPYLSPLLSDIRNMASSALDSGKIVSGMYHKIRLSQSQAHS